MIALYAMSIGLVQIWITLKFDYTKYFFSFNFQNYTIDSGLICPMAAV